LAAKVKRRATHDGCTATAYGEVTLSAARYLMMNCLYLCIHTYTYLLL